MEWKHADSPAAGIPEFTELGKRIEMLRIDRGLSKQYLARFAGTSRQQLWRVMTGKSHLTVALRARLADVLDVSTLELEPTARTHSISAGALAGPTDFQSYAAHADAISQTLASMPTGDRGRALKRRFLDAVEDCALADGCALDPRYFDLRRQVLNGEL
ncbi:MAG TPA: helix-turn-helix transcriptional regulator [Gemmatimonadaceae bacterium]|nr:helix-turn-helix transcriptional regulator [Gemmatimonadaceae bacterium]